jgi:hypothetical protein
MHTELHTHFLQTPYVVGVTGMHGSAVESFGGRDQKAWSLLHTLVRQNLQYVGLWM